MEVKTIGPILKQIKVNHKSSRNAPFKTKFTHRQAHEQANLVETTVLKVPGANQKMLSIKKG